MKETRQTNLLRRPARLALLLVFAVAAVAALPRAPLADFAVYRAPSHILSLFALPGESVPFDLATYAGASPNLLSRFQIESDAGVGVELGEDLKFQLTAPQEVGIYPVTFQEVTDPGVPRPLPYRVQLVVMRPADQAVNGVLDGYPVGVYPSDDSGQPWRFESPRGFVEVTAENANTLLSDHITLADLECHLDTSFPRYLSTRTTLLLKLEGISDLLLQEGLPGDHIKVMSGFRTPEYNRAIGNRTTFSRHIVGDAADIYLDRDGDGVMDDLNHDGRLNRRDAQVLMNLVEAMDNSESYGALVGGASAYRATHTHGPFVHVDTRGYPARW